MGAITQLYPIFSRRWPRFYLRGTSRSNINSGQAGAGLARAGVQRLWNSETSGGGARECQGKFESTKRIA